MLDPERLRIRAAFFRAVRDFFYAQGFTEADTPVLHPVPIPEANIIPISAGEVFLQTSPELCMKRLLAVGCGKIFQICPCFRKEERGRLHLEEFRMLEWYRLNADYNRLMDDCREFFSFLINRLSTLLPETDFSDLGGPGGTWQYITVEDAFARYCPISLNDALQNGSFDLNLVEYLEPNLGKNGPEILYDYPAELASLAKTKASNPNIAERFELYVNGVELANGFSELTDPGEQRARFLAELEKMPDQRRKTARIPEKFLTALAEIDAAAGIALGLDRLLMLFMDESHIERVQTFSPADF
ncbi:MAG: EF-P lysine aminoacylase GenX [Deltaproteobacteria bacterium]|nr:MAG: EF-P lysine aminoacylase GenX [Deltaproteobacteria bacterium]